MFSLAEICETQSQLLTNPHKPFEMSGFELEGPAIHRSFGGDKLRVGGKILFSVAQATGACPSGLSGLAEDDTQLVGQDFFGGAVPLEGAGIDHFLELSNQKKV